MTHHKRTLEEMCRGAAAFLNKGKKGKTIKCYCETTHTPLQEAGFYITTVKVYLNGKVIVEESSNGSEDFLDTGEDIMCLTLINRIFINGIINHKK